MLFRMAKSMAAAMANPDLAEQMFRAVHEYCGLIETHADHSVTPWLQRVHQVLLSLRELMELCQPLPEAFRWQDEPGERF